MPFVFSQSGMDPDLSPVTKNATPVFTAFWELEESADFWELEESTESWDLE